MDRRHIQIVQPVARQSYSHLGTLTCIIPSELTADACTVLELRLAPGQGSGLHLHQNEEEIVYVQHGVCNVGYQEQSWQLEAGSWVVFPKQTAHFFHNTSDDVCTLTITAVPGGLDRYFAALNVALAQQDEQGVAAINAQFGITFFAS